MKVRREKYAPESIKGCVGVATKGMRLKQQTAVLKVERKELCRLMFIEQTACLTLPVPS